MKSMNVREDVYILPHNRVVVEPIELPPLA